MGDYMGKIAFVFDGLGIGGTERVGIDYVKICKAQGYDVDVYNLNPTANSMCKELPLDVNYKEYKLSHRACPEVYSYGIQRWWWGKYVYVFISPVLSLLQIIQKAFIKKEKYDIAVAMSGHINDLSFVGKNYIKANKKVCWCHGSLISYLAICDAYPILYKRFNTIITLSDVENNHIFLGKSFLKDINIEKIYNPSFILTKEVDEGNVHKLKEMYGNYMLYVARFDKGKGQDTAIKALKELIKEGINEKLVFAGDGNEIDTIKELAIKEGVYNYCVFLGNVYNIQDYISASYINVLTSDAEGLPTVIIEAMMFGKPCVMTNCDNGEVSENGKYCILTQVGDYIEVARSLKDLYSNSEKYKYYEERAKERALEFNPSSISKKLFKVFNK